ncbi:hypothetical protein [Leptospira kmetyi]|uniref:hypothetical protein n=1 Tax=Leptospira kmetyi TaxID=408139 RepID=UPI0010848E7E|nr:hypothetical protein [Leptospira kmetyi]TGL73137.1 hypothetical protein EHQ67_00010 [Leptospira kmetyi]
MSGIRSHNFREGDRSEYLANYLLSGLGLATPVPRPEDIGIDFFCNISEQQKGLLSFGYPYCIQIKSYSTEEIVFGSYESEKWKSENIYWLFKQELPIFIGLVDKKEIKIDIYNTSTLSFIYQFHKNCSILKLLPRKNNTDEEVQRPKIINLNDWPSVDCGDGKLYEVDLGKPIISLCHSDFEDFDKMERIKNVFRWAIFIEQKNLLYRKMKLPYFNWILKNDINNTLIPAWIYSSSNQETSKEVLQNIVPWVVSLAINFYDNRELEKLDILKPILNLLPRPLLHKPLLDKYPEIFDKLN